ncbi:MAG: hypothetical protein ACOZB3_09510 [Calditrichota bacterium]
MRVGFTITVCLLFAITARAEYPLVVTQEIQIPDNRPWDVQHVTSDSTFGYAFIAGDSLYWAENVGEPMHAIGIGERICEVLCRTWGSDVCRSWYGRLLLMRVPSQGNDLCAYVQSVFDPYPVESRYYVLCFVNLEADSIFGWFETESSTSYSMGSYEYSGQRAINRPILWGDLPATTLAAVVGSRWAWQRYEPGGIWGSGTEETTDLWDFRNSAIVIRRIEDTYCVSLFADGQSPARFALGGYRITSGMSEDDWEWHHTINRWISTYTVDSAAGVRFNSPTSNVIAQVDGDGTQRIITEGMTALDPDNYEQLWMIPESSGALYSVRMFDGDDERILAYQTDSHRFRVYNASNGFLLGETSPIIGDIFYVLKPAGRKHEVVTWEAATLTIRVYTSQPPEIDGLTISYLPEDNLLRLSWSEVSEAIGYKIYAAPTIDGPWEWIVGLPGGQTVYHVPANDSARFFQVTAEYDE